MRIRLKAKDEEFSKEDKKVVLDIIRQIETKYPDFEIVRPHGYSYDAWRLVNLQNNKYVFDLDTSIPFIKELQEELRGHGLDIERFGKETIRLIHFRGEQDSLKPIPKPPVRERPSPQPQEERHQTNRPEGDTRYEFGEITKNKLRQFINLFGRYLVNEEATLEYSNSRSKWLPRFGYARNQDGSTIATDENKTRIKNWVLENF